MPADPIGLLRRVFCKSEETPEKPKDPPSGTVPEEMQRDIDALQFRNTALEMELQTLRISLKAAHAREDAAVAAVKHVTEVMQQSRELMDKTAKDRQGLLAIISMLQKELLNVKVYGDHVPGMTLIQYNISNEDLRQRIGERKLTKRQIAEQIGEMVSAEAVRYLCEVWEG